MAEGESASAERARRGGADANQPASGREPPGVRLVLPKGYQVASGDELIPWSGVERRLEDAANYWLATASPSGKSHVTPVWGVWVDRAFYFDGIATARWARNVTANPTASINLESGVEVVIVEGTVEDVTVGAEVAARILAAWARKYGRLEPNPTAGIFRLRPRSVRAWSRFPDDATRWDFGT